MSVMRVPPFIKRPQALVWPLLGVWLIYSVVALGWFMLNDPNFLNAICRT